MIFAELPVGEAVGAVLAHSRQAGDRRLRKGTRLTAEHVAALAAAGVTTVTAARLEPGELDEDAGARQVAEACAGAGVALGTAATGRVNLFAQADGLAVYDRDGLDALNLVDESVTLAAMPAYDRVEAGQLIATVKVIPLGLPEATAAAAARAAYRDGAPLVRVAPFRPRAAGLLQTALPGTQAKVLDKTTAAVRTRIESLHGRLAAERRVAHAPEAIAGGLAELRTAGADLLLIVGASATTDRRDVIPAGIEAAGGRVRHYGMPVDPGQLTVLAELDGVPALALPGSARSPRVGGNDWLLWRLVAGLEITRADVMRLGAGGLLKEIPTRPLPRAEAAPQRPPPATGTAPRIGAVVLAAGQSSRMAGRNKLTEPVNGRPLLLHAVAAAEASGAEPVVVVTGHARDAVEGLLAGRDVRTTYNPAYASGMASSLRAGLAALPEAVDGAVVLLGDMPGITAGLIDRLIAAFDPTAGAAICAPSVAGRRGNPVLLARRFFPEIREIDGDVGAKPILQAYPDQLRLMEMDDDAALLDLDTPDALDAYRAGQAPDAVE
jgi:molybdenum cofactor cytidylyltransferase